MPIVAVPDHVAVAVPSIDASLSRWRDQLGGRAAVPAFDLNDEFTTRQYAFRGGAKLELLEPKSSDGFAQRFLDRFGSRLHHVTLKVDDFDAAVEALRAEGLDVVDVAKYGRTWHEGFLRPTQIGGLIVQIAWAGRSDQEINDLTGFRPDPVPADGAVLHGPVLGHPRLDEAARVWAALGGRVERVRADGGDALLVRWPGAPLTVRVEQAAKAGPWGLHFTATEPLPHDPVSGAAVLA